MSKSEIIFKQKEIHVKDFEKNFASDDLVKIEFLNWKLDVDILPGNLFHNSTNIKYLTLINSVG